MMEVLACHPLGKIISLERSAATLPSLACPDTVKVNMQLSSSAPNAKVSCLTFRLQVPALKCMILLEDQNYNDRVLSHSPGWNTGLD